ncbi:acyl-CoA dehydrogenase [Desulfosarcina ovata subsp. sediminis]|uniref:Acyl-CoA dehydrogenase n=1 Tax=Desulfosarcina ovata subsp. sediminis TaxID=885957 RepID=A0A5K7ZRA7_9BACT|nr:acyl-CoA dehydrogenase family protein [Desulfosarcina ovata]BBO80963.1 acyl-CoA dehydrogenase [Desulfosarcina ovata subsp. sediminis]
MDFGLRQDQRMAQREARCFARREIAARPADRPADNALVGKMGQLGLFGCAFPEEYGGAESGFLTHSLVCEEISTVNSGLRPLFNLQGMTVPYTILQWGSAAAKERYVRSLVLGEKLGCTCFSEPHAGSDIAAIETTITACGDHFLLNGTKTWISNGHAADVALVYATMEPGSRHRGLCAVVVDTHQPGWSSRAIPKLGDHATPIAEIHLDGVRVPKENLLGDLGRGFTVAMTALDRGRISVASGAVGLAQACLDAAVEYARRRNQFGHPIATYQLIKGTIAEMVADVDGARLLVRRAAWRADQGQPFTREAAIAKFVAGETVVRAAGRTMEIFGGMGYSLDMPVERFYRDAKLYQIGEGTANIMKILIANDALGLKKANRSRPPNFAGTTDLA